MDKKITDYYRKAQRLIDETDGALLTYQEREGDRVVTNTLINPIIAMDEPDNIHKTFII